MDKEARLVSWHEWALFGLRWILLVLFAFGIYLTRNQANVADPTGGLVLAFAVGAVANFVVALFMLIPMPSAVPIVIAIGDIAIAAVFVGQSGTNSLLILGIASSLMFSAMLRLGPSLMMLEALGVLVATFGMLANTVGPDRMLTLLSRDYSLLLLLLLAVAAVAVTGAYILDQQVGYQRRRIIQLSRGETEELNRIKERTRAIYELTSMISSTLNYEKILDAALEAGRLASSQDDEGKGFVSAVLLFRQPDNALHVVASRRLTRSDAGVVVRGVEGIIGEAMREANPVIAENVSKDPELQYFSGFQYCRSVLCIPLRAGYDNFGVLVYGSETPNAFEDENSELLTAIGMQATVALQNAVLYSSLLEEKERLVDVEEDARKKLARDLHDGPTQSVAAIAMRMSVIYKMMERTPDQVPEELKKVEDLARKTTKEIRHMLFTLRPLVLESQGLEAALKQLADKMKETHGQAVSVKVGPDVEQHLDTHQQGVFFYIVEEAVNNARKHAQAEMISVSLARQNDVIVCKIADNGVGFDADAVNTNYESRGSLGMVNMRERAALLDGTLHLESRVGKGTVITIVVPLKHNVPTLGQVDGRGSKQPMSIPRGSGR